MGPGVALRHRGTGAAQHLLGKRSIPITGAVVPFDRRSSVVLGDGAARAELGATATGRRRVYGTVARHRRAGFDVSVHGSARDDPILEGPSPRGDARPWLAGRRLWAEAIRAEADERRDDWVCGVA